jgi:hypothetical protein
MPNLWPDDFGTFTLTPPITILREQAEFLGKKTRGMVGGRVLTSKEADHWTPAEGDPPLRSFSGDLHHDFYLEVPSLDNYLYLLFAVVHPLDLYPLELLDNAANKTYQCKDEGEFVQRLQDLLSSDRTKKVISALLAQVRAVTT